MSDDSAMSADQFAELGHNPTLELRAANRRAGKNAQLEKSGARATELGIHWHRVGPGGINEGHNCPPGCRTSWLIRKPDRDPLEGIRRLTADGILHIPLQLAELHPVRLEMSMLTLSDHARFRAYPELVGHVIRNQRRALRLVEDAVAISLLAAKPGLLLWALRLRAARISRVAAGRNPTYDPSRVHVVQSWNTRGGTRAAQD